MTTAGVHDDGNPAFGYRIDVAGRSILLSGDTTYRENAVKYGMNDEFSGFDN